MYNVLKAKRKREVLCENIYQQYKFMKWDKSILCGCGGRFLIRHYKQHCDTLKHRMFIDGVI